VILPKEVLARLKLEKGDTEFVTHAAGGIKLTPYNPEFEAPLNAARDVMKKRRNVLRAVTRSSMATSARPPWRWSCSCGSTRWN